MVVFVDLEAVGHDLQGRDGAGVDAYNAFNGPVIVTNARDQLADEPAEERENPNINGFSAALSCYP